MPPALRFPCIPTLLVAAATACPSRAPAQLFPGSIQDASGDTQAVAVGDFNGDDLLDLVAANNDLGTVSVLLQVAGDGFRFLPAVDYTVAGSPIAVAIGDLNNNGVDDIVTASAAPIVTTLFGNGDGTFSPGLQVPLNERPAALAIGDLDRDGNADVATANPDLGNGSTATVLLSDGVGGFRRVVDFGVEAEPLGIAIADVDGDGFLDIGTSHAFPVNKVTILRGRGTASFPLAAVIPIGIGSRALAFRDLDGDGKLDLINAGTSSDTVSVRLGDGAFGFGAGTDYPVGDSPRALAIADLNDDGELDVATANRGTNDLSILLGDGTGSLQTAAHFATSFEPSDLFIADVNSDGFLDVVTDAGSIEILSGNGAGGLNARRQLGPDFGPTSYGDLNSDGFADVVLWRSEFLSLLADGSGSYLEGPTTPDNTFFLLDPVLFLADLNGDQHLDLITAGRGLSRPFLTIRLGDGTGAFGAATEFDLDTDTDSLAAGDFNGDGNPDILTGGEVLFGDGLGGILEQRPFPTQATEAVFADLNGDGALDVISAGQVQLGDGLGGVGDTKSIDVGGAESVEVADANGDGKLDMIAGGSSTVSVVLGDGSGSFGPRRDFSAPGADTIAIGDVNGDGIQDIVTGEISVLLGLGNGLFEEPLTFGSPPKSSRRGQASEVALIDIDLNGRPDIYTSLGFVLENQLEVAGNSVSFGRGTPGCAGVITLGTNSPPSVGNQEFAFICTNAPPSFPGLYYVSTQAIPNGTDTLGIGLLFHIGASPGARLLPVDGAGVGFAPLPIPNLPGLADQTFAVQAFFLASRRHGDGCSTAMVGGPNVPVSSRGLSLTILP